MIENTGNRKNQHVLVLKNPILWLCEDKFPNQKAVIQRNWLISIGEFLRALRKIRKEKYETIFFLSVSHVNKRILDLVWLFVVAKKIGMLKNIRYVFMTHKTPFAKDGYILPNLKTSDAAFFDKIITYYSSFKESLPQSLRDKTTVVKLPLPTNTNLSIFESFCREFSENKTVYASGKPNRDFESLVNAVYNIDATLYITSPRKLANLPENCIFCGKVPYHEHLALMARAQVIVIPLKTNSAVEGLTVLKEAMRLGKPVITTTHPALDDHIIHEHDGLRVTPGDIDAYRTALERLLDDPELCRVYGERGRQRVKDENWKNFSLDVDKVINEM